MTYKFVVCPCGGHYIANRKFFKQRHFNTNIHQKLKKNPLGYQRFLKTQEEAQKETQKQKKKKTKLHVELVIIEGEEVVLV